MGGSLGSSTGSSSSQSTSNYDGKGTYLIFNAADTIFISDLNSQDKVLTDQLFLCWFVKSRAVGSSLDVLLFRILSSPSTSATLTLFAMPLMPGLRMGMICSLVCTRVTVSSVMGLNQSDYVLFL